MRRRRGDIAKGWRHRSLSVAFAQKITSFYTAPIRAVTTIVRGEMGVIFIFSSLFYSFVVLFFFSLPGPLFCRQLTYGMSGDYTVRYGLGGRKTWRRETNKRRKKNGIFSLSFSGSRGFGRPLPQRHAHVRRAAATLCSLRATSFSVHFFFFFSSCVFSKLHIIVCRTASLSYFLSFVCCHFVNVIYWHERIPRFPALLIPRLSHFLYKRKKKRKFRLYTPRLFLFFLLLLIESNVHNTQRCLLYSQIDLLTSVLIQCYSLEWRGKSSYSAECFWCWPVSSTHVTCRLHKQKEKERHEMIRWL